MEVQVSVCEKIRKAEAYSGGQIKAHNCEIWGTVIHFTLKNVFRQHHVLQMCSGELGKSL